MILASVLVLGAACATSDEWSTWRDHPTHFASTRHMQFSLVNYEGATPRVFRQDLTMAESEGWWGKSVTVAQEQILER